MGSVGDRIRTLVSSAGPVRAIPWAVLVLGLVISAIVFLQLQAAQVQDLQDSFAQGSRQDAGAFRDTLSRHGDAIESTSALFAASEEVDRDEFHAFVERLRLAHRYPGFEGIALAEPVPHGDRQAYVDERRAEGNGDFAITPPGNRSSYWVVTYETRSPAFPEAGLLPLGLDLRTRAPIRAVLAEARDLGKARATPVGADGLEAGTFLVARPLYADATDPGTTPERRDALVGWTLAYASPQGLLAATETVSPDVGVRLLDGPDGDGLLLAQTAGSLPMEEAREEGFLRTETVDVFGETWTVESAPRSGSAYLDPPLTPSLVLGGSLLVTGLLVGLVRSVSRSEIRARRRVEAATEDLRQAQQVASVGSWEWHVPSDTVTWSDEQYRLFGREPGEPADPTFETFLESVHPEDRDRVDELITEALEERSFPTFEYRIQDRDGSVRWLEARGNIETDGEGRVLRMRGTNLDVTDRKELEEELRDAMHEAEAADRAKSMFLATMSHEIRTPMNAILGLTEILRDSELTEEQRRNLDSVHASGEHLLTLIDDILDFSKIEAGELALEDRPFDLRQTIEEGLEMVNSEAGRKGLELAFRYGEGVPEAVRGDPGRVRQVLVNLLSNAVKFTEEGEIVCRAYVPDEGPGEGEEVPVAIEVEDTGIGIEEDDVEDLFDPFSQADASARRQHEGTGLGLAISHRLVELMGGTLEAEGEPGVGSTFRFTIPFETAELPEERTWRTGPASLEGARVLVVDDNETSREIVGGLAERWEMVATTVADPGEALDILRGGLEVDVAVVDYSMPDMTGVELVRRMRSGLGRGDLPVVMVTSMPEAEHEVRTAGVDVVDVIVKPVVPSDLFEALQEAHGIGEGASVLATGDGVDPSLGDRLDLDVLVVEDDDLNRRVAREMLDRLGVEADGVEDGEAGVSTVQEADYDVVFMDVQMPGMDGHEATRRIREEVPEDEQPRIVALTAHAGVEDRERALEAGMDDYVSKPVAVEELGEALERAASGEGQGGPGAAR